MAQIKSSCTVEKNLIKKVNDLLKENKSLRKKISKLRKMVDQADIAILGSGDHAQEDNYTKYSVEECDTCRGEIKEFSVMGMTYKICQKCKSRKKVNPKK